MLGLDPEDPEGTQNGAWLPMTTLRGRTSGRGEHECEGTEGMARYSGVEGSRSEVRGHGSTGHASGRRIIKMLGKKKAELGPGDFSHTRKVNGYVQRHQAQRPEGDVRDSRWRYSLMNWVPRPSQVLARRFAEGSCRRRTLRGAD
jgi:hypothetical protein